MTVSRSMHVRCVAAIAFVVFAGCKDTSSPFLDGKAANLAELEQRLETLRGELKIPGMGVAISEGDKIVWSKGLGLSDIARVEPAKPTTDFHIASLTKAFAGVILVNLVSQGVVSLDDPVTKFGVVIPGNTGIKVRHLANMTSEGTPGSKFSYNGDRFALLEQVITSATGISFGELVVSEILKPLDLTRTAPNLGHSSFAFAGIDRVTFTANLATGYTASGNSFTITPYPTSFGPAAGLISTAEDMALFSIAIDSDRLLTSAERSLMFEAAKSTSGATLPYAIGWFSQNIRGITVQWSYGYWTANSALIIRIPSKQRMFVALANSDGLSANFALGSGDLMSSPVAREFLEAFAFPDTPLQ